MEKYYQRLKKFSLFNTHFAFMDTEDYLADGLFMKHQVRVHFGDEFVKPGSPYRMILCHVRKKDVGRFKAALAELPNKMLLCGHSDYLSLCLSTWEKLERRKKETRILCEEAGVTEQAQ